ncbi:MAG: hypothetical protein J6T74_06985 [Clostridia bacterium]|nr:hypothetical protein [Clostridia bacterium]
MKNMRFIPLNDILNALAGKSTGFPNCFYEQLDPDVRPNNTETHWVPSEKANACWANGTPQYQEPKWNGDKAFELANDIKARRAKIDEIKAAQQAELEREQKALEEAEKQYHDELSHIRYVGDDKQLQLLIPREKMFQLVKGLTDVINGDKEAKSYKVTIHL